MVGRRGKCGACQHVFTLRPTLEVQGLTTESGARKTVPTPRAHSAGGAQAGESPRARSDQSAIGVAASPIPLMKPGLALVVCLISFGLFVATSLVLGIVSAVFGMIDIVRIPLALAALLWLFIVPFWIAARIVEGFPSGIAMAAAVSTATAMVMCLGTGRVHATWSVALVLVLTGTVVLWFVSALSEPARDIFGYGSIRLAQIGPVVAIAVSWIVIVLQIGLASSVFLPIPEQEAKLLETLLSVRAPGGWLAALVCLAVVPATCEEFFFRGLVFRVLLGRLPFEAAAALSALLFAIAHLDIYGLAPRFVVGLVLAIVVHRTGCLWYAVALHAAYNATVVVLMNVVPPSMNASDLLLDKTYLAVLLTVGMLSFVWLHWATRLSRPERRLRMALVGARTSERELISRVEQLGPSDQSLIPVLVEAIEARGRLPRRNLIESLVRIGPPVAAYLWARRTARDLRSWECDVLEMIRETHPGTFVSSPCPACQAPLKIRPDLLGQRAKCLKCGEAIVLHEHCTVERPEPIAASLSGQHDAKGAAVNRASPSGPAGVADATQKHVETGVERPDLSWECPSCRSLCPRRAVVCMQCGYNAATARRAETDLSEAIDGDEQAGFKVLCPKCGRLLYPPASLRHPVKCPHCKHVV
nr:hypothetical protein fc134 [uncultured bacterium]